MTVLRKLNPKRLLVRLLTRLLVQEHHGYRTRFPNDMALLRQTLRPGDVVLVEGSQRISEVIKYLTQSSWSHVALYVGDALVGRGGRFAEELREEFGDNADALLMEATIESGVAPTRLDKYAHHNIRICRPINLRPGDLADVIETIVSQLGTRYSVRHIVELLVYFFPIELIPDRFRLRVLESPRIARQLICSSQIAMAFQKVRYPVQPAISSPNGGTGESAEPRLGRRLFARKPASVFETHVFTPCNPRVVTPRDFDLSPYFEVIKFNAAGRKDFDYKKINWADRPAKDDTAAGPDPLSQSVSASPERG